MSDKKLFLLWRLEQANQKDEVIDLTAKLRRLSLTEQEDIELDYYTNRASFEGRANRLIERIGAGVRNAHRIVLHVHTPKAVGTSLNQAMLHAFYQQKVWQLIPRNSTPKLLRFACQNIGEKLPYLATGHIPLRWLLGAGEDGQSVVIPERLEILVPLRPVEARINSMRNQILMSFLIGTFSNRPYAYRMPLESMDLCNKYLFPVKLKGFCNPMFSAFGWTAREIPSAILKRIFAVSTPQLEAFIHRRYDAVLTHESKNRTVNLSRFLFKVPRSYSLLDYELDCLLSYSLKKC